jgi:hypothetical protein
MYSTASTSIPTITQERDIVMEKTRCAFIKENSEQCKSIVLMEDGYCLMHSQTEKGKEFRQKRKDGVFTKAREQVAKKFRLPSPSFPKQVKLKCLDCCCGNRDEVKFCSIPDCPLWMLRFGTVPKTYVSSNGEGHEVLFDKKQFDEGGIFYGADQSVEEARKVLRKHLESLGG